MAWGGGGGTARVGPHSWVVACVGAPPGRVHVAASSHGPTLLRLVTALSRQLMWRRHSSSRRFWLVRSGRFGGVHLPFYHLRQMELDPL